MNEIDTTGHQPGCPEPVGGDCDCTSQDSVEQIARENGLSADILRVALHESHPDASPSEVLMHAHRLAEGQDVNPPIPAEVSGLAQVWCDKCDQPATREIALTNGSTAFRCSTHAWALVAPKGR